MIKRRIFATLLVAGVLSLPGPAFASHGEPIYDIRFYSDASYTQQVGEDVGYCIYYGVAYSHSGQSTNYATYDLIGYCANDGHGTYMEPI
jgi:hypothetical protein